MKKLSLFAMAAAGLFLAACSDNDAIALDNSQTVPVDLAEGGYIGISLSLPSASNATRANDSLNNGTAEEFTVKNATVYIFGEPAGTAAAQSDPVYVDKFTLGTTYEADVDGPGYNTGATTLPEVQKPMETKITSTYSEATLISNQLAAKLMNADSTFYAYVILNHNGQITAPTAGTTKFSDFSKQEFNVIGADISAKENIYDSGLLMTSSPISAYAGGDAAPAKDSITTLVKIDGTKIFGSAEAAKQAPAACVYVERAAVKITVVDATADAEIDGAKVKIDGWQIINYNEKYYNTRQVETAWNAYMNDTCADAYPTSKYRFVSYYQFQPQKNATTGHTQGWRTFFAKDVNFNGTGAALLKPVADTSEEAWIPVNNHAYTTENTFDVENQTWKNTTQVTLKVNIGDNTFYTVGKDGQVRYDAQNAYNRILELVYSDPEVTKYMKALIDSISKNNPLKIVKDSLALTIKNASDTVAGKANIPYEVKVGVTLDGASYTTFVTTGANEKAAKDALDAAIADKLNANAETGAIGDETIYLNIYKGGVTYYNVRIKHFGDAETPWSASAKYINGAGLTVPEIYGTEQAFRDKMFLGRYGLVRDNWYTLNVTQITKIGSAEPINVQTTTPDTPDDEIEKYISVEVHILPWVLRTQNVVL